MTQAQVIQLMVTEETQWTWKSHTVISDHKANGPIGLHTSILFATRPSLPSRTCQPNDGAKGGSTPPSPSSLEMFSSGTKLQTLRSLCNHTVKNWFQKLGNNQTENMMFGFWFGSAEHYLFKTVRQLAEIMAVQLLLSRKPLCISERRTSQCFNLFSNVLTLKLTPQLIF